jgi:MFS family permease
MAGASVPEPPARTLSSSVLGIAIVAITGMQLMSTLDGTIVIVALPRMQADLDLSDAAKSWVITAYVLTFGGLLLLGGRVGDAIGHKRAFISGVGVFTIASMACGLATDGPLLIAARAVQAGGAGNLTGVQIRNPVGSNTIFVLEQLEYQCTGTNLDSWIDYVVGPDFATLQNTSPLDTRWNAGAPVSNAVAVVSSTNGVPNPTPAGARAFGRFPGVASSGWLRWPIVLKPGSTLGFTAVTVNVAVVVNFIWRERTAQPGEL